MDTLGWTIQRGVGVHLGRNYLWFQNWHTCKELYNKVTLYVNPSLISHDGQVELLNAYEKEFWEKISYIIDPSILDRPKLTCSEEL